MAKYTTSVRSICEVNSGLDESKGQANVNDIIANSRDKIFDFTYPIYDENYRPVLESKILKHYYTREICAETVGRWKLFLDARMNEIMPYYNKLYESELLRFNPLYDVDYTRTSNRVGNQTGAESGTSGNTNIDLMTGNVTDTASNTNVLEKTGTVGDSGSQQNVDTMGGTVTDSGLSSSVLEKTGNVRDDSTSNSSDSMTGTVKDDGSTENTRTNNLTRTNDLTKTNNLNTHTDETTNDVKKNSHWDYYSDTPQGGVRNVPPTANTNGSTASGEPTIQALTYLTNARHIIDDGTGSELTVDRDVDETGTVRDSGTVRDTGTVVDEGETHNTKTFDTVEAISSTSGNVTTHNTKDETTGSNDNTKTYDTTNTTSGTTENTTTYNTKDTNSGVNENTKAYNTKNERVSTGNTSANKTLDTTEAYIERVIGKTNSHSYVKLLQEWRDSFLNIDMLIIRDLNDLFFALWE